MAQKLFTLYHYCLIKCWTLFHLQWEKEEAWSNEKTYVIKNMKHTLFSLFEKNIFYF